MGKKDESVVLSLFQKFLRNSIYNRINVLYNGHEIPMKAADMTDPKPLRRVFGTKYYFFSPLIEAYSFSISTQSIVPCTALTVASCPAYRFLKRQVM